MPGECVFLGVRKKAVRFQGNPISNRFVVHRCHLDARGGLKVSDFLRQFLTGSP